jgi:hypothetical protein
MVTVELSLPDAVQAVSDEYDADVYLYSGSIDHEGFGQVVGAFAPNGRKNALLILTTHGGLANSAYKISRFFQSQYERFDIFIPSVCKSAGTLLALGANRLIMSNFSELGPLDVQLYERDEIGARKSGLLSHSAFEALKIETFQLYEHFMLSIKQRSGDNISFPVASDVAGDMAARVMEPIFAQVSPNILGSDYRDLRVAIEYGNRLAQYSDNISPVAVRFLTEQYPSHDFIIDMQEAEDLFNNVLPPADVIWPLLNHIEKLAFTPHEPTVVLNLNTAIATLTNSEVEEDGDSNNEVQGSGHEEEPDGE